MPRQRRATEADVLRLALLAYEAAVEPDLWAVFLRKYAEVLKADAAFLQLHDFSRRQSKVVAQYGLENTVQQSYHEQYSPLNIWRNRGERLYRTASVLRDEELCDRGTLNRSAFYNDYLKRVGLTRSMSGVITRTQHQALSLPVMRGDNRPCFEAPDQSIVSHLLPHLAKAEIIQRRLDLLSAGQDVLDQVSYGIAFLTEDGGILHLNTAAEAILAKKDGLTVVNGRLCAVHSDDNTRLTSSISETADPGFVLTQPLPLPIRRNSLRPSYCVLLARAKQLRGLTGMHPPSVLAFIVDPEDDLAPGPDLLKALWGLTKQEARVALKLSEGKGTSQVANELGMGYETARTHVKRILQKTGTQRQTALTKLIRSLPTRNKTSG